MGTSTCPVCGITNSGLNPRSCQYCGADLEQTRRGQAAVSPDGVVAQPTRETPSRQSWAAYQLAAVVLVTMVILIIVDKLIFGSTDLRSVVRIIIYGVLAAGLARGSRVARWATLLYAILGAILPLLGLIALYGVVMAFRAAFMQA